MSLHKNGVITGLVDSYCLPCELYLATADIARAHIEEPHHKNNLDVMSYVDGYKDDGIRKVPQGYYCEYCNKLINIAINVKFHVSEGEHRRNKDSQWLREQGDVIVVLNQLVIDNDSWHGLVDGACALCNTEYLDKEAHKTIPTHLLKLIQSTVELHRSGAIYRKGNDFFHCLVCNTIFPLTYFGTHFQQKEHLNIYNKCCEAFKCNLNNQVSNNNGRTADNKEISDAKIAENSLSFEIATDMIIENQQLLLQKTANYVTFDKKSIPKADCTKKEDILAQQITSYEHVFETETNDNHNIHSEFIPSKDLGKQEKIDPVNENVQESILKEESETNTLNDENILQTTTNEVITEEDINRAYKNHCEIIMMTPENFFTLQMKEVMKDDLQMQHKNRISEALTTPTVKKESETLNYEDVLTPQESKEQQNYKTLPESKLKNENKSDTLYDEDFREHRGTNNKQVPEAVTNKFDRSYLGGTTIKNVEISQIIETFQEAILECFPQEDREVAYGKEVFELQFPNKENTMDNTTKESNETNGGIKTEQSYETQSRTVEDPIKERLPLNEREDRYENVLAQQKDSDNEMTIERAEDKFNENDYNVAKENSCETHNDDNIIQKVEQLSISKKEKAKVIANENKIRYKDGYTRAFCSICHTNIPSSLKNIKVHVTSKTHKYEARRIFRYISNVTTLNEFVRELRTVKLDFYTYVVINDTYCLNLWSYLLMTKHRSYIRCHVCELNLNVGLFNDHASSETHNSALANILVVCSLPTEFIREVQPGFYHCGYCNWFEGSWRAIGDHCNSTSHVQQKSLNIETRLKAV